MSASLQTLLTEIHQCTLCAAHLPLPPRPVVQAGAQARMLIVGQAPGIRAHESHQAFNDPSGERLREWMGIGRETFYNADKIALLPMGFCYPGSALRGDLPPRPECARHWRPRLNSLLPHIELTLLVGQYAMRWYLGKAMQRNLTETVRQGESYAPVFMPLPHPSPRNNIWLKNNPWFEQETLPLLRQRVANILGPETTVDSCDGTSA